MSKLETVFAALDAANEVALDMPSARVRSMTVEVDAKHVDEMRTYLDARVFADGAIVGGYGDLEVRVEVRR